MQNLVCAFILLGASLPNLGTDGSDAIVHTARYRGGQSAPAAKAADETPFQNRPRWKCDAGTGSNVDRIEFTATPDSLVTGYYSSSDGKGGVIKRPLEARYARSGREVWIYTQKWVDDQRDPNPMMLGHSNLVKKPVMTLYWQGKGPDGNDNHWTATLPNSKGYACTDHKQSEGAGR